MNDTLVTLFSVPHNGKAAILLSEEERRAKFIEAGLEIALGGATVVTEVAGFGHFAHLSPIITPSIIAVVNEFSSRSLGRRQTARASGVLLFAAQHLGEFERAGRLVRDDGFFSGSSASRSSGEEVIEAVLHAAQDTHEEKKLKYFGQLLASIAVDPTINRSLANLLVRTAQSLSYTQYCLLFISLNKHRYELRKIDYINPSDRDGKYYIRTSAEMDDILCQIVELWTRQIISMGEESSMFPVQFRFVPSEITCRELGSHLYNTMRLHRLPESDVSRIAKFLRGDTQFRYIPYERDASPFNSTDDPTENSLR